LIHLPGNIAHDEEQAGYFLLTFLISIHVILGRWVRGGVPLQNYLESSNFHSMRASSDSRRGVSPFWAIPSAPAAHSISFTSTALPVARTEKNVAGIIYGKSMRSEWH